MLRISFYLFAFALLIPVPVYAQNAQWPLYPEQIFAPDIPIEYAASVSGERMWSNELRVLSIDGGLYRYPPTFQGINAIGDIDEKTVLIGSAIQSGSDSVHQRWIFDRATREIRPFESQCVENVEHQLTTTALIEVPWTIIPSDAESLLCNHFTGEHSPSLPTNHVWVLDRLSGESESIITASPDKRHVIFFGQIGVVLQPNSSRDIELFSYDTVTRQIFSFGQFHAQSQLSFDQWVGTQVLFSTGGTCSICSLSVYIADAAIPDSMEPAFSYLNRPPAFLDDPPRFVFGAGNPSDTIGCGQQVYDVAARTMMEISLGGCRPDFGTLDGIGYYRNVPTRPSFECCDILAEAVPTVAVTRWDAQTGESRDILIGEVEQVRWVSDDERYAILLLDDNGVIDNVPYSRVPPVYGFTQLGLIDLETGEMLTSVHQVDQHPQFTIHPLNDREFLMIDCTYEVCGGRVAVGAIHITIDADGNLQHERLLERLVIGATPDRLGILQWTHPNPPNPLLGQIESLTGVGIYDIQSALTLQLINPLDPALYEINIHRIDKAILSIVVDPKFPTNVDSDTAFADGQYNIHFSEGELPVVEITHEFPALGNVACLLYTATTGVNIRANPGGDQERIGGIERGHMLLADGQAVSANDDQIWWRLADGGWIRSDFTLESEACGSISTVDPMSDEGGIPELQVQDEAVTCLLTTVAGVNLRGGPGTEFERSGSAAINMPLRAVRQAIGPSDFMQWWQLDDGMWVRTDFVDEGPNCDTLPTVTLPDFPGSS